MRCRAYAVSATVAGSRTPTPTARSFARREMINRFRALVIPPAWTDVWICPDEDGHLQVTARDARGRKQYRYHPGFRQHRDGTKFERMFELSDVLWKIRERVESDIELDGHAARQDHGDRGLAARDDLSFASAPTNTRRPTSRSASRPCAAVTSPSSGASCGSSSVERAGSSTPLP